MYYTVQQTAENLEIELGYLMYLIQTKQVKTVEVDGEVLLNSAQFDFFLKQRERLLEEYQKYLDEPIPEDIDIKDEDQSFIAHFIKNSEAETSEFFVFVQLEINQFSFAYAADWAPA